MPYENETDWMEFVGRLCNGEGYPTIDPRRYHGSVDLRRRVQEIMTQSDGWMIVLKPRETR